jgi:hypothetical protein
VWPGTPARESSRRCGRQSRFRSPPSY